MNNTSNDNRRLENVIEVDETRLSISTIECIANDSKLKEEYEKKFKGHLYVTILLSLTHKSFSETQAASLWQESLDHMQHLNQILGRNVGISVAVLDYLSNIKKVLSEAKIIEEDTSDYVAASTTKDELTSLFLRDVFDVMLKKFISESKRENNDLCLMMLDIDDFKIVNDTYGHIRGDEVLSKIGKIINQSVREMDMAARYGGEEMAVIMPNTDIEQACQIGERIRKNIESCSFNDFSVTVSIGVSQLDSHDSSMKKMIEKSDTALYKAKKSGKNQLVASNES